ncbi:hypothetical protein DFH07DRAFT_300281 [Mycena maculata]|uniref:DUF6533 domain-containing protein n=1 Tax=Mycena maculata TaxID=230809 RepID=A0AAD7NNL2_9AGAR|nr:hypothetical protein DFH07DRAFT_300281 [Mycena maculata]
MFPISHSARFCSGCYLISRCAHCRTARSHLRGPGSKPLRMLSSAPETLSGSDGLPSTRPLLLYLYFCAIAVLYYDHILTIPEEVEHIWRRPKSRSSYWFFLNRYLTFFATLPITVFNFVQFTHDVCGKYAIFRQVLLVVQVFVVDFILSLRVYAMYGLNKRILYILGFSAVAGIGIAGWAISAPSNSHELEDYSVPGCFLPLSSKAGIHCVLTRINDRPPSGRC